MAVSKGAVKAEEPQAHRAPEGSRKKKGHVMQNSYKYSLKRRISSAYIGVYVGICVLMLMSFVVGCGMFVADKYEEPSGILAEEIALKLSEERGVDAENFREYLYERCIVHGTEEVFVYNTDNELLVATSYIYDNDMYFSAEGNNVILRFFPSFVGINDGLYINEEEKTVNADGVEYEVRIIMYHSVSDEIAIFRRMISMSFRLMLIGLVLIITVGSSRTSKMLTPIREMTEVAAKINGENMQLRFDTSGAKFELSELAETINSMMDRIRESYDKQKRFVSDVSHELRTPISVISGYANMLNRWGKEDEAILEEGITNIIQEADTMSELVQTLLFLARHDNETLRFEPQDVNVTDMMTDIVRDAAMSYEDVRIYSSLEAGVSAYIDEARIKQVVRVFIDNGVKYSKDGEKTLEISLKKNEEHFEISVKDNGIGISPEDMQHVFERFYRADESRTKSTGGHGLGLSIAKVIVLSHGGKIKLRSKVGEGSEFIVMLPYRSLV